MSITADFVDECEQEPFFLLKFIARNGIWCLHYDSKKMEAAIVVAVHRYLLHSVTDFPGTLKLIIVTFSVCVDECCRQLF